MASNTVGSAESREVQIVYRGSSTGPPFFMARPQNVEVSVLENYLILPDEWFEYCILYILYIFTGQT